MMYLRQSTPNQSLLLGPFVDDTDGKSAATDLTITATDIWLSKSGRDMVAKNSGGGTHDQSGWYRIILDEVDTDTVGSLQISCHVSSSLPVWLVAQIVEEAVYDADTPEDTLFETSIDATWGGPNANAYDTLENVSSFIKTHIFDRSSWDASTLAQREAAIFEATRDIDSVQYAGHRYYPNQALEMPRSSLATTGSRDQMVADVREALAYQAIYVVRLGGRNYHAENQAQGVKSYSEGVGPIRESYTYGNASVQRLSPEASAKLAPWRQSRKVFRG